jgi:hypothetical protein
MNIDDVKKLYFNQGLSVTEVGKTLGITKWRVISLMRKNKLKFRHPAETLRIQFNRKPLTFNKILTGNPERKLYVAGLMIYLSEGAKSSHNVVDLANSDLRIILVFLAMLRKVYRVSEAKLRVLLYCYANQNKEKLVSYWSQKTGIPTKQFTKPYVRKDFKADKVNKMPYGLVHIRYNDKKLFMQILADIDIIARELVKS